VAGAAVLPGEQALQIDVLDSDRPIPLLLVLHGRNL
jgi:hypothetical protein